MKGVQVGTGAFLDFSRIDFKCPFCVKIYWDDSNKYLNRCNKNKSGFTKIKCSCGQIFGMTYNYKSEAVGFKYRRKVNINERRGN